MNVTRWKSLALLLSVAGLAGCADLLAPTEPEPPPPQSLPLESGPVALLAAGDPTAIPIGSPALVEFLSRTPNARRTIVFPQSPPQVDVDQLTAAVREWLTHQKALRGESHDLRTARSVESIEQILAARTPAEIRAALGPVRERIVSVRSIRPTGPNLFEHTVKYRLDGRDVLRVLTLAGARDQASFECASDPNNVRIIEDPECGDPEDYYDPYIDPEPVVADVAAMQADLDAASAQLPELDALANASGAPECQEERSAFWGSSLAFSWRAAEAIWYAWRRNVPKTYSSLRDASFLYGATYALYQRYKECVAQAKREKARPGRGDESGEPTL